MVIIRDLRWDDMDDLIENYYSYYDEVSKDNFEIGLTLYHEKPDYISEINWFTELYINVNKGNAVAVVAEDGGRVVGLCDIQVKRPYSDVSHIGTLGIAIRKEYRNRGIGHQMIRTALDKCKGKFEIIVLEVFDNNKNAIALYRKIGFIEYGRMPRGVKRNSKYFDIILMYYIL